MNNEDLKKENKKLEEIIEYYEKKYNINEKVQHNVDNIKNSFGNSISKLDGLLDNIKIEKNNTLEDILFELKVNNFIRIRQHENIYRKELISLQKQYLKEINGRIK